MPLHTKQPQAHHILIPRTQDPNHRVHLRNPPILQTKILLLPTHSPTLHPCPKQKSPLLREKQDICFGSGTGAWWTVAHISKIRHKRIDNLGNPMRLGMHSSLVHLKGFLEYVKGMLQHHHHHPEKGKVFHVLRIRKDGTTYSHSRFLGTERYQKCMRRDKGKYSSTLQGIFKARYSERAQ